MPKLMDPLVRMTALLPRVIVERVAGLLGVNDVFAAPDAGARAAYDARLAETIEGAPVADDEAAVADHEAAGDDQPFLSVP